MQKRQSNFPAATHSKPSSYKTNTQLLLLYQTDELVLHLLPALFSQNNPAMNHLHGLSNS